MNKQSKKTHPTSRYLGLPPGTIVMDYFGDTCFALGEALICYYEVLRPKESLNPT